LLELQENRSFVEKYDHQNKFLSLNQIKVDKKLKNLNGDWKLFMVLKSLVYLSDFGTLLLLKKDWNKSLKKKILKNLLLGDSVNLSSFRRRSLWE
jgi:hypothetical protein